MSVIESVASSRRSRSDCSFAPNAAGFERSHKMYSGRRHERERMYQVKYEGEREARTVLSKEEVVQMENEENWGENTTCITANTSERSVSYEELRGQYHPHLRHGRGSLPGKASDSKFFCKRVRCSQVATTGFCGFICLLAFLSPIAMVLLPKIKALVPDWRPNACTPDCEGLLLSFSFKLFILLIGMWALFYRRSLAVLPRVFLYRVFLLALVFMMSFAYWLFYGVRIFSKREENYTHIVTFALSLVDALLFIHYIAVILLELRHLRPEYRLRVVRSPDGETTGTRRMNKGDDPAAIYVLQQYYREFSVYNPFLEKPPTSRAYAKCKLGSVAEKESGFKVYDIDGGEFGPNANECAMVNPKAIMAAAARKRDSAHNERFYEELEWERRVKKRKARLLVAAEEAFSHIRKTAQNEKGPCVPMDCEEASQSLFSSFGRSLQKYLKITRQQPRHSPDSVMAYLSTYLNYDMAPKAFLERFFTSQETHEESQPESSWSIVSPEFVSKNLSHGTTFQLRCHSPGTNDGIFLLVTATRLPFFDLTEDSVRHDRNQFVFKLNSETSV